MIFLRFKKEISDTFFLLAMQGFNYIAPLVVFPYLMIVLGAEKFGHIGFSLSIVQYLMLVVDFGFNLSATKRVAQAQGDKLELSKIFYSTMVAKIFLLFICLIALFIIGFAIPRFQIYQDTLSVLSIMLVANAFSFVWFFQGIGKIRVISIVNIISKLLIFPITFVIVKDSGDYIKATFVLSIVYLFSSVITTLVIIFKKYIISTRVTLVGIIEEVKESFPIFLSQSAISLYTSLFVVILGYYSLPEDVGKYSAVERIMRGLCFMIYIPVSQAFYPKFSSMQRSDLKDAKRLLRYILLFFGVVMSLIGVFVFIFADKFALFLGADYEGSASIFRIMAFLPLFISLGGIIGQIGILALGDSADKKIFQRVYFIAGLVSVVLALILTPMYNSIGASIALLITEGLVFLLMIWFGREKVIS